MEETALSIVHHTHFINELPIGNLIPTQQIPLLGLAPP